MTGKNMGQDAVGSPDAPRVSAVVPVKGEAKNLPFVLPKLSRLVDEIVMVDLGPGPQREVASSLVPEIVFVKQRGRGKGSALSAGFEAASGDIIVAIDGDGSMDPGEIPALVGTLVAGADVAKGSRRASGGRSFDVTPTRAFGNRALLAVANVLAWSRWTDFAYGYFGLWRDVVDHLALDTIDVATHNGSSRYGQGFEIEALVFCRAQRAGLTVREFASVEHGRIFGTSNLRVLHDGFRVLFAVLRERFAGRPPVELSRSRRAWHVSAPADSFDMTKLEAEA